MYPILYPFDETEFTSNGLGRLVDCISVLCTEERNGMFEVEFTYPLTGVLYNEIRLGRIISCTHDDTQTRQPFRIYRKSAPLDGIVTFNARHVAYGLQNVIVEPFSAISLSAAFSGFASHAITDNPYTFWTNKASQGNFLVSAPSSIWELLGGKQGSILDVYGGGEYKFDKYTVRLYQSRGSDSGVTIRYGKNLTDLEQVIESDGTYNAIVPYWTDGVTTVVGSVVYSSSATPEYVGWTTDKGIMVTADADDGEWIDFALKELKAVPYDFSSYFEEAPTTAQLNNQALTFLNANQPWIPKENITVDFIALWQTTEYANYAALQRVKLCDTVTVLYPGLGVNATAKIVRTVYNVLLDRYDEIEVGEAKTTFGDLVAKEAGELATQGVDAVIDQKLNGVDQAIADAVADVQEDLEDYVDGVETYLENGFRSAIENATKTITGGFGGHVVIGLDANNKPQEIFIMDTEDIQTAVKVFRMNVNGMGFSDSGVNGTYRTAWTFNDAAFVADFITTGNINANLITTGVINASLIKAGILDGLYFQCVNLVATNATVTGIFKAFVDSNNYLQIDSNGMEIYAQGHKSLALGHNFDSNNVNQGSRLSFFDFSGNTRLSLWTNAAQDVIALRFLDASGNIKMSLQNTGFWFYMPDGNPNRSAVYLYESTADNAYWRMNDTYSAYKYSVYGYNGLWFYDPAQLIAAYDGIISMMTSDNGFYHMRDLVIGGSASIHNLSVDGSKNRVFTTKDYGKRKLYSYETPSPMFGDVGEGVIAEDGRCYIWFDPIFSETIQTTQYQVFLQAYGDGRCYVSERHPAYFVVCGTPGMSFGWETKAKQADFTQERLEPYRKEIRPGTKSDLGGSAQDHINDIKRERGLIDNENGDERDSVSGCDWDAVVSHIFGD